MQFYKFVCFQTFQMILPRIKKAYAFFWILLLGCSSLFAGVQPDKVAILPDSVRLSVRLKAHLLINPEEISSDQLDSLQQKHVPLAFLVSGGNRTKLKTLISHLPKENRPVIVVYSDSLPSGDPDFTGAIVLPGNEMDKIQLPADPEVLQNKHSFREFLWMTGASDTLPSLDYFIRFWQQTGKLPNFIQVDAKNWTKAVDVVASLNNEQKIFGVARNGNQLLADVSWKDYPDRNTSGYFSFPVSPSPDFPLSPYKAGYQFSPDIILPSPENLRHMKVFNAVPLDPDFGLTDQFTFSKKVLNLQRKNDAEVINYGLDFVADNVRGNCAFFSGKAYLDGGLKSRLALKPNFSVTAWIKPTLLGRNNCILGKGKDFVLKIHGGLLTFTVQGVKDYYSAKTRIPADQWSFIGLVHTSSDNHISFYLNGELTEKISLLKPYTESDNTLLIGSNLWEEFFVGYISEIKIWDRELNQDEIRNEFLSGTNGAQLIPASRILWILLFLGLMGFALWRWVFRRKRPEANLKFRADRVSARQPVAAADIRESQEKILCFGGLKVLNSEGKDISQKFSPKIRQLFVLIFLHSVAGQKGISSKKLSDCLWPGMNQQNAKNIRGTNIQNLKALLASCRAIKLVFEDKLWRLELAEGYFADYDFVESSLNAMNTAGSEIDLNKLQELVLILKRGPLFPNIRESWLDPYIDRMSNRIIEFGVNLFRTIQEEKQDALLLDIAEIIILNDPLNEPALRKKIGILTRQGKLSLAHAVFDNFTKLYSELYQEKYHGDFKALFGGENTTNEI